MEFYSLVVHNTQENALQKINGGCFTAVADWIEWDKFHFGHIVFIMGGMECVLGKDQVARESNEKIM